MQQDDLQPRCEILTTCKTVTGEGDKLQITGPFDTLTIRGRFPCVLTFTAFTRVRVPAPFRSRYFVEFALVDEDGKRMTDPIGCEARGFDEIPRHHDSAAFNLALTYNARFERIGIYQLDLFVDKRLASSIPLFVDQR